MAKRYIKIFFVLCLLGLPRFCHANSDIYEVSWRKAEALRQQHKLDESQKLISEMLKKYPDSVPAIIALAEISYAKLDFSGAARFAARAIKLVRGKGVKDVLARAYVIYGLTKGMLAHYGGPLSKTIDGLASGAALQKAQKLRPNDPFVLFGVGSYYLLAPAVAGKDLGKAEEYLKKAVALDPLFVDAYVRLAQVYNAKGDAYKYRRYMDNALAIDPESELALDIESGACRFVCPSGRD